MLVGTMNLPALLVLCVFCYNCTALVTVLDTNVSISYRVDKAWVFPRGRGSWIENLAVRPNGQLLLTRLDTTELFLFDVESRDPWPTFVHLFPNAISLTGIVEIAHDVFAVSAGNYTPGGGATPGSWAVWRVDMNPYGTPLSTNGTGARPPSRITKIADIPEAAHLKSLTPLSDQYILLSDFRAGIVYRLDVTTGAYTVVIADSLTAAVPQPIFGTAGVNGLQVRGSYLYFTNTGQNIFARIPIRADGRPAGAASIMAHTAASTDYFDGFTFGADGDAYLVTGSGNAVVRIPARDGPQVRVAGRLDSGLIAEPTACAFGRGATDQGVLYVVTGGAVLAPVRGQMVRGGAVVWLAPVTGSYS